MLKTENHNVFFLQITFECFLRLEIKASLTKNCTNIRVAINIWSYSLQNLEVCISWTADYNNLRACNDIGWIVRYTIDVAS